MAMASSRPTSLLSLFVSVLLFSSHVFAVSAVLGIDFGTAYLKATLVKPGLPLGIVLTKDSRRKELATVAFKPSRGASAPGVYPERAYGSDAAALGPRFPADVYPNLKTVLGQLASSAVVQEYSSRNPALQLQADPVRGTVCFKSTAFPPEEPTWSVEELLAMELQSIQRNGEALAGSGNSVRNVVITVPPFYTTDEKRAVVTAANLAGLEVSALISDGLAVGLNYATSREFPNVNGGKPEIHMVLDMGAGSTKATIMKFQSRTVKDIGKFNKTVQEVQVLGSGWDRTLGGDALNTLLVDDMIAQFVATPGAKKVSATAESIKAHGRTVVKLTKDAERLRQILTANSNTQASFSGLYEDVDFKYQISRADYETMAEPHAERVGQVVRAALEAAKLEVADIDSVILHGGATRTPFVQRKVEQILGGPAKLRTNVNSDEAAVFGAGFRAAELSPSFRVKEIRIAEAAAYAAGMKYVNPNGKVHKQRLWTSASHLGGVAKEITFKHRDDFEVEFYQTVAEDQDWLSSVFLTTNLTETVAFAQSNHSCEESGIQFKIAVRLRAEDGEVDVIKAVIECEGQVIEKEGFVDGVKNLFGFGKKDQKVLKEGEDEEVETVSESSESSSASISAGDSTSTSTESAAAASESPVTKKKQLVTIPIKFTIKKLGLPGLTPSDFKASKDRLRAFELSDKSRKLREEAFNLLEAFTYKVRDLLDSEAFIAASTEKQRLLLSAKRDDISEWIYGDGADATRDVLKAKLKELKDLATPIESRVEESAKRPGLVADLQSALKQTADFLVHIRDTLAEFEAWEAKQAAKQSAEEVAASATDGASDATTSTASDSAATTTATPSPSSKDDFADLEDEPVTASAPPRKPDPMDALKAELGPPPPLFTHEDLLDVEKLSNEIRAWLKEKLEAQDKLGPTDDPVLLVKDLAEWRDKLDKAGVELTMKSVKNANRRKAKDDASSSAKLKKAKKTTTSSASSSTATASGEGEESSTTTGSAKPGSSGSPKFKEDAKARADRLRAEARIRKEKLAQAKAKGGGKNKAAKAAKPGAKGKKAKTKENGWFEFQGDKPTEEQIAEMLAEYGRDYKGKVPEMNEDDAFLTGEAKTEIKDGNGEPVVHDEL